MEVMLKRIYESAEASDEYRILTDRLWPRGISREKYLQELDHNPGKEDFLSRVKSHPPFLFSPHPARKKIPAIGQIDGGDLSFLIFQMRCEITSFRPYRPAASEA